MKPQYYGFKIGSMRPLISGRLKVDSFRVLVGVLLKNANGIQTATCSTTRRIPIKFPPYAISPLIFGLNY